MSLLESSFLDAYTLLKKTIDESSKLILAIRNHKSIKKLFRDCQSVVNPAKSPTGLYRTGMNINVN